MPNKKKASPRVPASDITGPSMHTGRRGSNPATASNSNTPTPAAPVVPADLACTSASRQLIVATSIQRNSISASAGPALPSLEPCDQPALIASHAHQSSNSTSTASSLPEPAAEESGVLAKAGRRGHEVTIEYLFRDPSVQFVHQEGLILCSAYIDQLDSLKSSSSSLGAVKHQMKEAGLDLAPAIQALLKPSASSSDSSERAVVKKLWTRPRDSATPPQVKCTAIAVALLPRSWESGLTEEEAEDPTAALQDLYSDICVLLRKLRPTSLVMVAVGKTQRFNMKVVAQELLSLFMFKIDEDDRLRRLRVVKLATFSRKSLDTFIKVFNQQDIKDSGQVEKLPELVGQLRQLLPDLQSLPEVRAQVEVLILATEHATCSIPEFQPHLHELLEHMGTAATNQAATKLDEAHSLLPGLKAFLSHLQQHLSITTTTNMRLEHTASVCCTHLRLVLEVTLKFLFQGGLQPSHLQKVVAKSLEDLWQQQQQKKLQQQQRKGSKNSHNAKLMAGDYMYLLRRARNKDKNVAVVYTSEVEDFCDSLRYTGIKAVHPPGQPTIVDANVGLSVLQQLLSLLLKAMPMNESTTA